MSDLSANPIDPELAMAELLWAVVDALEPLGFEAVVITWNGSEPFVSLDLGGVSLDLTACVRQEVGP